MQRTLFGSPAAWRFPGVDARAASAVVGAGEGEAAAQAERWCLAARAQVQEREQWEEIS
jgi:hypothetical protein